MKSQTYSRFSQIDGTHDFRKAVPGGYVDYEARAKRGGRVAYFNFALAREMGLIPARHEAELNSELEAAILDTFAIQIINEYDRENGVKIPKKDLLGRKYMATRYLQLQHRNKRGETSGDGRSVWNGQISHNGTTWDVTSCGTGSTCLSPAAATLGYVPRTGDPTVSYGCGKAEIDEGISAALQSEIFHRNGVGTERTLAVIAYDDGTSINVRAGTCLLRPSHFFAHLKQGNRDKLKGAIDYFIERQGRNGEWKPRGGNRYFGLAAHLAVTFARMAAKFESEYIFVWMDWDGDNILANGGIIDYGSVRQFGLYHHAYRFDDGDRWSTTIPEQKLKARATVQGFIQIADFLTRGSKTNFKKFRRHPLLKEFDREFERELLRLFLEKNGFTSAQQTHLLDRQLRKVRHLHQSFTHFEKATRARTHRVADGITRDAVYCMRDLLRELPGQLLKGRMTIDSPETPAGFLGLIASRYATRMDRTATGNKCRRIREYLVRHQQLLDSVSREFRVSRNELLGQMSDRATWLNPRDRITGVSAIYLTARLVSAREKGLSQKVLQRLIESLIRCHVYSPDALELRRWIKEEAKRRKEAKVVASGLRLVAEVRQAL